MLAVRQPNEGINVKFHHVVNEITTPSFAKWSVPERSKGKKTKFKRQEHRSFIDWFITVPEKITRSGHRMELKMYSLFRFIGKHHFFRDAWEELDISASSIHCRLIEAA